MNTHIDLELNPILLFEPGHMLCHNWLRQPWIESNIFI